MFKALMASRQKTLNVTVAACTIYLLFDLWLWVSGHRTSVINYYVNVFSALLFVLSATIAMYAYQQADEPAYRRMYLAWGIGLSIWAVGLVVWSYYNLILQVTVPFPSLADIFFVSYYAFMGYGTLKLLQIAKGSKKFSVLASVPIVVISFILVFFILNRPDLSSDLPILQRVIGMGYSLGDAVLLSITLLALQNSAVSKLKGAIYWIIVAFLVMLTADFIFFYATAKQTYYNGDISDMLYGIFPTLLAIGIARSYQEGSLAQPPDETPQKPQFDL